MLRLKVIEMSKSSPNLQCWALTCESFFDLDEWLWKFAKAGYQRDYEFIYFE